MASLTAGVVWAARLSMTRMASGLCSRRTGSTVVWRKSRKTGMVVPVVTVVIATTPPSTQDGEALPVDRRPGRAPGHGGQDPALVPDDQAVRVDHRHVLAEVSGLGGGHRPPLLPRPASGFLTTK